MKAATHARARGFLGVAASVLLSGLPAHATTPPAPEAPSVLPMILTLVFVLALIPAAIWLMKRLSSGPVSQQGGMKVVGSLALGPRERLVMVDDGKEVILLGVTAHSITRVGTQPRRELPVQSSPSFAKVLRQSRPDEA